MNILTEHPGKSFKDKISGFAGVFNFKEWWEIPIVRWSVAFFLIIFSAIIIKEIVIFSSGG